MRLPGGVYRLVGHPVKLRKAHGKAVAGSRAEPVLRVVRVRVKVGRVARARFAYGTITNPRTRVLTSAPDRVIGDASAPTAIVVDRSTRLRKRDVAFAYRSASLPEGLVAEIVARRPIGDKWLLTLRQVPFRTAYPQFRFQGAFGPGATRQGTASQFGGSGGAVHKLTVGTPGPVNLGCGPAHNLQLDGAIDVKRFEGHFDIDVPLFGPARAEMYADLSDVTIAASLTSSFAAFCSASYRHEQVIGFVGPVPVLATFGVGAEIGGGFSATRVARLHTDRLRAGLRKGRVAGAVPTFAGDEWALTQTATGWSPDGEAEWSIFKVGAGFGIPKIASATLVEIGPTLKATMKPCGDYTVDGNIVLGSGIDLLGVSARREVYRRLPLHDGHVQLPYVPHGCAAEEQPPPPSPERGVPVPPRNVTAEPVPEGAEVTWTAPESDGGSPISKYTAKAEPGGARVDSTSPTARLEGLRPGTAYTITVTATNERGESQPSDPSPPVVPLPASGTVTQYPLPTARAVPWGITTGSDRALWFAERNANKIGRVGLDGKVTEFPVPTANSSPERIVSGPDGALWFTERAAGRIGRITTNGHFTEFALPSRNSTPIDIAAGSGGVLWYADSRRPSFDGDRRENSRVGRISTTGRVTEFEVPPGASADYSAIGGLTVRPDGSVWTQDFETDRLMRISPEGAISEIAFDEGGWMDGNLTTGSDGDLWLARAGRTDTYLVKVTPSGTTSREPWAFGELQYPDGLTADAAGRLWYFVDTGAYAGNKIERFDPASGDRTLFPLPGAGDPQPVVEMSEGPDGGIWYTDYAANAIGRLQP